MFMLLFYEYTYKICPYKYGYQCLQWEKVTIVTFNILEFQHLYISRIRQEK